jgi:hypothetical protein
MKPAISKRTIRAVRCKRWLEPVELERRAGSGESPVRSGAGGVTHEQRIANYCRETGYPRSLFVSEDGRIVGTWIMGQNYTVKSAYYGGYPHGYLARIKALFPDKLRVLHLFSGRVDLATLPGKTVDINSENAPDYVDDAQTLDDVPLEEFDLVCADPPYSVEDCDHYQTTMVKRNVVMRTLGARLKAGSHVVWLDQVLPMFRKDQFALEAVIGMVKSTNHRFRVCSIFRAGGGGAEQAGEMCADGRTPKGPNEKLSDR